MMYNKWHKLINISAMVLIYIAGLFIAGMVINNSNENINKALRLSGRKLPSVSVLTDSSNEYNHMDGYLRAMDTDYIHGSISVLGGRSSVLSLNVSGYHDQGLRMDYEITDYSGDTSYVRAELGEIYDKDRGMVANIPLGPVSAENSELILHIMLYQRDEVPVHYYLRLQQGNARIIDSYLDYIESFVDSCISKSRSVAQFIEPLPNVSNLSLGNTGINSSFDNITFGSIKPSLVTEPKIELLEFNDDVAIFKCRYALEPESGSEATRLYVSESYRLRLGTDRVILLNFERKTDEAFNGSDSAFGKNSLGLGITSDDMEYLSNQRGDRVIFKKNKQLWAYNNGNGSLNRISLWSNSDSLYSDNYDIRLLKIDEQGNADFIVFGYIPAGEHEGMNGIIMYKFDASLNSVIEQMIIRADVSYPYLRNGLDELCYLSSDRSLYFAVADKVYSVAQMTSGSATPIVQSRDDSHMVTSDSRRYIAYVNQADASVYDEEKPLMFSKLHIKDLNGGADREITAEAGQAIIPLGFLGEDLIYGSAGTDDKGKDIYGNISVPYRKISIISVDGIEKKSYQAKGHFVKSITINDSTIELSRVKKKNGMLTDGEDDRIIYSGVNNDSSVGMGSEVCRLHESKRSATLVFSGRISESGHRILNPLLVAAADKAGVDIFSPGETGRYYVFVFGEICGSYQSLYDAIATASERAGAVIDLKMGSIWQRAAYNELYVIDYDSIGDDYHSSTSLGRIIREKDRILDLNGCSMESVLYFLKHQKPVLAMTEEKGWLLIVGYDNYNLIMRSFDEQGNLTDEFYYGKNDSRELFEKSGNRFVTLR